ncbi:MAG: GH92 family glycosyl hydrolase [Candidatus Cryptobacteroides sp.]|nr:GH92 family glycosyl hydrolase [Bacteroidales bacterium]
MKLKFLIRILAGSLAVYSCCPGRSVSEDFTKYVDVKIGTGGHGHVFVGADVPFGMVQLGPTSIPQQWDWCSGYHDSDSTVIGFSHTHLSGTGIGDLFDVTVMPVNGAVKYARGTEEEPGSGLWSYADRSAEIARPGYYSVPLTRYGITAELTATDRVGIHRYTYSSSEDAAIVFDLENGGCWDKAVSTFIEKAGDSALRGYRYSKGWANDQKLYFYAELSVPFESFEVVNQTVSGGAELPLYARAGVNVPEDGKVLLKVALSPVSIEGAKANMEAELPGWDFDEVAEAARSAWNAELGKFNVETSDETAKKIFYTALYHTMIAPSTFCDVNGDYRGADGKTHPAPGYKTYTTFSLWDAYRAAMPLYSIFQNERYVDMINTMLAIYQEQGKLPVWHLHGCETNCMVGNPGIPPVADAIVKGIDGIDRRLAFKAMKESAMRPDRGQDFRMQYGYIPCDLFNESVAYDLEYALADAALANAAETLAKDASDEAEAAEYRDAAEYFKERSHSYRHLFDPDLQFIRGRDSKGEFRKEYSPFASSHRADDYCEGNGWQYTWLVPNDFKGLMECFGGRDNLLAKLDTLFLVSSVIEGEASPDISGLIGQYAHGNEPSHHILYFYTMAGQPWKTADKVRDVLSTMYRAEPDGLSGNEDVGQMSAWYIMSSLGFYEVEAGSGRYWFGVPAFDKVSLTVPGGKLEIEARGLNAGNKYVQRVLLNGNEVKSGWINHSDIVAGGSLVFEMGPEPVLWYDII